MMVVDCTMDDFKKRMAASIQYDVGRYEIKLDIDGYHVLRNAIHDYLSRPAVQEELEAIVSREYLMPPLPQPVKIDLRTCYRCGMLIHKYDYIHNGGTRKQWDSKHVEILCCACLRDTIKTYSSEINNRKNATCPSHVWRF